MRKEGWIDCRIHCCSTFISFYCSGVRSGCFISERFSLRNISAFKSQGEGRASRRSEWSAAVTAAVRCLCLKCLVTSGGKDNRRSQPQNTPEKWFCWVIMVSVIHRLLVLSTESKRCYLLGLTRQ